MIEKGDRVKIIRVKHDNHASMVGLVGTVVKTFKTKKDIHVRLDDGRDWWPFVENVERV